jgi:hypothetical protein
MPPAMPGETFQPAAVRVDRSDNLYLFERGVTGSRLLQRHRQGRWRVLAESGTGPDSIGQVSALAVGPTGNIYVAEVISLQGPPQSRVRMLNPKGRWTTVAAAGHGLGQVSLVNGLATDSVGRLYVGGFRLQARDVDGKWFVLSAGVFMGVVVDRHDVVYTAGIEPPRVLRWTPQPKSKAATRASEKK